MPNLSTDIEGSIGTFKSEESKYEGEFSKEFWKFFKGQVNKIPIVDCA